MERRLKRNGLDNTRSSGIRLNIAVDTSNIFKVPFLARSISKSGIISEPDSLILLYNFFNMKREAQCVALIKPNFSNPMCNLNTFKQTSYKRYCNHDHLFCKSTIRCHRLQLNTSPQGV